MRLQAVRDQTLLRLHPRKVVGAKKTAWLAAAGAPADAPRGILSHVDRFLRTYQDPAQADEADRQYYASLSPQERLDMVVELVDRYLSTYGEAAKRFERVHRIDELPQR
jgi:hypothetical protein